MARFNPASQNRIDAHMRQAGLILLTSPSSEHAGGLAALAPRANILPRARLSAAQARALGHGSGTAGGAPRAVAPGIVVIPASAPSPGSQLVYVRLENGREYLFAGDIAPFAQSWKEQRGRSRYHTDIARPEDRAASFAWLRTIASLKGEAPRLRIVPGHDYLSITEPRNGFGLTRHFPGAVTGEQATGKAARLGLSRGPNAPS
jgi:glyoxylase-like metal-dependent hydrolase (beta-lactamase superfamily II)